MDFDKFYMIGTEKEVRDFSRIVDFGEKKNQLIYDKDEKKKTVLPVPGEIENVTFASYNVFAEIANDTVLFFRLLNLGYTNVMMEKQKCFVI